MPLGNGNPILFGFAAMFVHFSLHFLSGTVIVDSWIDVIFKHYKRMGVVLIVATLPFVYFYTQQQFYNHVSMYFEKQDPALTYYNQFREKFGNDEVAAVVFRDDNIFTRENLALIREMTAVVKSLDDVENVLSLTEAEVAEANGDFVGYRKLIPENVDFSPSMLDTLKQKSLAHPLISGNLISKDGTISAIMVELAPMADNNHKHEVLNHIRDNIVAVAGDRVKLLFSGEPYLEMEIERLTQKDNMTFIPVILLIIVTVVFLMLRSVSLTVLCQVNILVIMVWSIGLLVMCGNSINPMTVIIAPIILAISIADSIHILSYYKECYRKNGGRHMDAAVTSIRSLWLPCLFTSLTTGIGFLSFLISLVGPVRTVGIFTAIGVMIAFALTIVLLPVMMMVFRPWIEKTAGPKAEPARGMNDRFMFFLSWIGHTVTRHYKLTCLFFLAITVALSLGLPKLHYKTASLTYLKDSNPVKQSILFVDKYFRGTVPMELVLRAKSADLDFTHPESVKMVETIQKQIMLENKALYTSTFSVSDYIKENHRAFNGNNLSFEVIPDDRSDILDYYELGNADLLNRVITPDRMEARISFATRFVTDKHTKNFVDFIDGEIRPLLGNRFNLTITGMSGLYITLDGKLKISQARSFISAFILIFIMMVFVCRNVKLAVICMIPNLFPIAMTLGFMGLMDIPLDVCTIMIASVTMGIAVDDTIHFITWFRRNSLAGMDTKAAIMKTFHDTGKSIVTTSMVLCLAYLVVTLGSVTPVIAFGALTSLAMFLALVGDLFILPALLMVFKPSFQLDAVANTLAAESGSLLAENR